MEAITQEPFNQTQLLHKLKVAGIESVDQLENFIRARLQLKLLAVKAKGYMTIEDIKLIKFINDTFGSVKD